MSIVINENKKSTEIILRILTNTHLKMLFMKPVIFKLSLTFVMLIGSLISISINNTGLTFIANTEFGINESKNFTF